MYNNYAANHFTDKVIDWKDKILYGNIIWENSFRASEIQENLREISYPANTTETPRTSLNLQTTRVF